jgi:hypothetical protein
VAGTGTGSSETPLLPCRLCRNQNKLLDEFDDVRIVYVSMAGDQVVIGLLMMIG